jgi:hypothetical protein
MYLTQFERDVTKDLKHVEGIELLADEGWAALEQYTTILGDHKQKWMPVRISMIHYQDGKTKHETKPAEIEVIYSTEDPENVATNWEKLKNLAKEYKWAEQADANDKFPWDSKFEHWPNSEYKDGNWETNSNTFVRYLTKEDGLRFQEMSGLHPGANSPGNNSTRYWGYPRKDGHRQFMTGKNPYN